jgi:hypothetical protein
MAASVIGDARIPAGKVEEPLLVAGKIRRACLIPIWQTR